MNWIAERNPMFSNSCRNECHFCVSELRRKAHLILGYTLGRRGLWSRTSLLVNWCSCAKYNISSGVNMMQDLWRICIWLTKRKNLALLDLSLFGALRLIAALTSCFFFSTEYALSVRCAVCCLDKDFCDSLEFLDVSNASSTTKPKQMKKSHKPFCFITECLRRWCLFLMTFEHLPSTPQPSVFIM